MRAGSATYFPPRHAHKRAVLGYHVPAEQESAATWRVELRSRRRGCEPRRARTRPAGAVSEGSTHPRMPRTAVAPRAPRPDR